MVITPFHRWANWDLTRSHSWCLCPGIGLPAPSLTCQATWLSRR